MARVELLACIAESLVSIWRSIIGNYGGDRITNGVVSGKYCRVGGAGCCHFLVGAEGIEVAAGGVIVSDIYIFATGTPATGVARAGPASVVAIPTQTHDDLCV